MSDFVVSARKYRPVRFDEVVGQGHVSQTLKNALRQNRLAHAFLFCGPRGVGKTTNARILAKVLNCLNVSDDFEPCNTCANCMAFNQNASFNIFELDGASNNKVDHMHQLMEQVRIPPQAGRKKVYIIDEVHMLTASAFNAFLKTLEEPPEYAVFILATTEKHKILPTILSRCQVYDFHRIKPSDMVAHLEGICKEEGITAEPEALHLVAEKADGALRDALSIFDRLVSSAPQNHLSYAHAADQLNVLDHTTFFQVVDSLLREDVAELYLQFDQVLANGFEPEPFLAGLANHLRQLFVCKSPTTLKLIDVSEALRSRYAQQAALCNMGFLINALNLAAECDFRLRQAANKRLHIELYLVKMAFAQRTVQRDFIATPNPSPQPEREITNADTAPTSTTSTQNPEPKDSNTQAQNPQAQKLEPKDSRPEPKDSSTQAQNPQAQKLEPKDSNPEPRSSNTQAQNPQAKSLIPQSTKSAILSGTIPNLPSISFDEDLEDEIVATVDPVTLKLEQLQDAWDKAAGNESQRIAASMRSAILSFNAPKLSVRVGSLMAQNTLKTEANSIREIKSALNCPDLNINIEYDETLAPKEAPKQQVFGPKEQYQLLINSNPAVETLRQRFGLELEE